MDRTIQPAGPLSGVVRLPGDKSISHRYAMLSAIGAGRSEIQNYSTGADCSSTLGCLRALGVPIARNGNRITIDGVGLDGLQRASQALDAGNSGSTIRMLSGILAGQPFETRIFGDESLSRRPMRRVMTPLTAMGAKIAARDGEFPPLTIRGGRLKAIDYISPVASAQVKSAVLFAGLFAEGTTSVTEPIATRNHSEIALRELGAGLRVDGLKVSIAGRPQWPGRRWEVPSDISGAAFFLVAGLLLPGSDLTIENVGLNPTRTALLDVLQSMGARIEITRSEVRNGERAGDLRVTSPSAGVDIEGGMIAGETTAGVIDEIPVLAVLGAASREGLEIRDAAELRVKETDRIATVAENLARMGIKAETVPDGIRIPGRQKFRAARLDSFGDHRIAMAFVVAALAAGAPSVMHGAEAASVSFPEFYDVLERLRSEVGA
jgi:3-phosphoshikimate 1-carboxyvinyltransferase